MNRNRVRDAVRFIQYLFILLLGLVLGCAEVAAPPGGPVDRTGPYLIGSIPENGAVNVGRGNMITLFFSEPIVGPTKGKAVFISPRPAREPKIKWKSDHVKIILPDSFKSDVTYIVSAGSKIADLRGNRLDSSLTIAFATGPSIDSGRIAGRAYSQIGKPKGGVNITLYDAAAVDDSTVYDSLYGDYVTQSNSEGFFSFEYLPEKEYRLIAYEDENRNERFNHSRESFAVPDRPVVVGGAVPLDDLFLGLQSQDTILPEIIGASYTPDGLVRIRLSREIELAPLRDSLDRVILSSIDDSTRSFAAAALMEAQQEQASTINIYPGRLNDGQYVVKLTFDTSRAPITYSSVTVVSQEDAANPLVTGFVPDDVPRLAGEVQIEVSFSEPLDTTRMTGETFLLWELPETRVPIERQWLNPLHLSLTPREIKAAAKYRLELTEFEIVDYSGNRLGDSLRDYSFATLDEDSLGWISGAVSVSVPGKEDDPVLLTFEKLGSSLSLDLPVMEKAFKIKVPAGKYLLSGFVDSDRNGQKGDGSIRPFRLAETVANYPDTVAVRARFETAGIEFKID